MGAHPQTQLLSEQELLLFSNIFKHDNINIYFLKKKKKAKRFHHPTDKGKFVSVVSYVAGLLQMPGLHS